MSFDFEYAATLKRGTAPEGMRQAIDALTTRRPCSRCHRGRVTVVVGDRALCASCGSIVKAIRTGKPGLICRAFKLETTR